MSKRIIHGVPSDRAKAFCRLQTALGATRCDIADRGDGTSDVTVEFPGAESYNALTARRNG